MTHDDLQATNCPKESTFIMWGQVNLASSGLMELWSASMAQSNQNTGAECLHLICLKYIVYSFHTFIYVYIEQETGTGGPVKVVYAMCKPKFNTGNMNVNRRDLFQ